jgi:hypothetical protein
MASGGSCRSVRKRPSESNAVKNVRSGYSHPSVAQLVLFYRIEQSGFVLPALELIRFSYVEKYDPLSKNDH